MDARSQILLVEDDQCTRELIEEILTDEGYTLSSVPNGLEAIELLKNKKFSLLITDFKMPGLNGVELLRWCRSQNIDSRVVFMTGASKLVPEEASALNDTQATLVQKPLNLDHFLRTVEGSLSSH